MHVKSDALKLWQKSDLSAPFKSDLCVTWMKDLYENWISSYTLKGFFGCPQKRTIWRILFVPDRTLSTEGSTRNPKRFSYGRNNGFGFRPDRMGRSLSFKRTHSQHQWFWLQYQITSLKHTGSGFIHLFIPLTNAGSFELADVTCMSPHSGTGPHWVEWSWGCICWNSSSLFWVTSWMSTVTKTKKFDSVLCCMF